jgi:hypothetical protein
MDGLMDKWMDGWMDGWMDELIDKYERETQVGEHMNGWSRSREEKVRKGG